MQATAEVIQKARQHAQRKYTMAMEKIVKESQDKLAQERAQMTAKGSVLSGGMWKITANNYGEMIESLIRVRLESLLGPFELYGVPLDNEIESEILRDVTNWRRRLTESPLW